MSGEENFRKSLNDRLNGRDFPFEESDWAAADKFITAARRKRRLRPLYWIIPIAFGIGATFLVLPEKPTTEISAVETQKTDPTTKSQAASPGENNHSNHGVTPSVSASVDQPQQPVEMAPHKSPAATPATNKARTAPAIEAVRPKNTENSRHQTNSQAQTRETEVHVAVQAKSKQENSAINHAADSKKDVAGKSDIAPKENQQTPAKVAPKEEDKTIGDKIAEPVAPIAAAQSPAEEKSPVGEQPSETAVSTSVAPQETTKENPAAAQATAATASVASPATALPDTDYVALQRPLLTIEAGALLNRGWNSGESKEAGGFNPLVGINYFQNLSSKLAISAGLQYYTIRNLNASSYTSRIVRYGHGEQSEVSTYTPAKLHYMAVPLQVSYRIGSSNTVGGGVNIGYLLTVDVTLEQYTQTAHGSSGHRSSKERGYMEGFKSFDNQLSVFYRRRFLTSCFAGAEVYYGLTTVKDSFFSGSGKEKNMGLKLTLGYYLLKSK